MHSEGQITLTLLHDLALLYLGLAHGADEDLDPAEARTIAASLRRWQPDKDPALIDHVIREATLSYMNGMDPDSVHDAIDVLGENLPHHVRATILQDLMKIASADGEILSAERDFIEKIADAWNIEI